MQLAFHSVNRGIPFKLPHYLCQCAVIPPRMLHHVPLEEAKTTAVNAICHPIRCNCGLLLPLSQHLHLMKPHHHILIHDHNTHLVLLALMVAVAYLSVNNFNDDGIRMIGHGY